MKNSKGQAARKLAISILLSCRQGAFVNKLLDHSLDESGLSQRDRSFVTALVFGVLKNQAMLDEEIKNLSKRPLSKLPPFILILLRIAFFQLIYMPDMPVFAVVFTSAGLAKQKTHKGLASYVNGILRQYLRNKNIIVGPIAQPSANSKGEQLTSKQLSVSYSIPQWLIARWLNNYGYSQTMSMLDFFQKPPDLAVRTNTQKISTTALIELFKAKKIIVQQGQLLDDCLILQSFKGSPKNLPGYKEGLFIIQDEASAFVAKIVSPKASDFVVDLCAAPGSKTLYLADLMQNQGHILAVDKDNERFNYLKEKCLELKLNNIEIKTADARTLHLGQQADKILLDAPCTGTGVLHRRQDLRHNKQAGDIEQLVSLQRQLLTAASQLIRPDGVLVYSTCSLEPEENIDNIKWFLDSQPQFKGDNLSSYIPKHTLKQWLNNLPSPEEQKAFLAQLKQGMLQLLPFQHGLSGFFICRLIKRKE